MAPMKPKTDAAAKLDKYRRQNKDSLGEDGDTASGGREVAGADTDRVLEAISALQAALTTKIEEVKVDVSLVRQDLHKLKERVKTSETRLGEVEDAIPPLQTTSERMQYQINQLLAKQDDMENRLRRCNLRFIGLPEGTEGKDPTTFLEQLLITTYGREAFSPTFAVERAHRMPARPPPQGAPPRTFIAKLLNYKDRDATLRMARLKGNIPIDNVKVAIFPDFSTEVQKRRQNFTEAKRRLRIKNLKYSMLFPARLRVEDDGRAVFFDTPEDTIAWLERRDNRKENE